MKKENRYFFYVSLIFLGVIIGIIFTSRLNFHQSGQAEINSKMINEDFSFPVNSEERPQQEFKNDFSKTFIEINKKVTPSVVSIRAVRKFSAKRLSQLHGRENRDLWDNINPFREEREFRQGASGSGIIVHPDGYILTNTHVVKDASQLVVTLVDNRSFPGQIIGIDSLTEVAVIKIDTDDLPVAVMGNSDKLSVGQWVLAIGNPLELKFTITAGIISAIGRQMSIIRDGFGIENFIQTDAVINPGNSGGALVDLQGNVIGVNTAIATRSGYYEGYGFAIPINLAKGVMEDLITEGRVVRAYLGIAMKPMDYKIARAYGMEKPVGVFVDNIRGDGPAGVAGIKSEDIIFAINDTEVNQANQIQTVIAQKEPGEEVRISLYRKGKKIVIPVVLDERETSQARVQFAREETKEPEGLGLEVKSLTRRNARELGVSSGRGVLVTKVERFSKAFDAGLYADRFNRIIILKVNDKDVDDEDEFWQEINRMDSGDIGKLFAQPVGSPTGTFLFIEIP